MGALRRLSLLRRASTSDQVDNVKGVDNDEAEADAAQAGLPRQQMSEAELRALIA